MTAYNIIKSMTRRGNSVIGSGCYAAALASRVDGNKVIKIGNNINDPWLDYYHIIKENQHNPCVPRIYSFYLDEKNEYYVCTMERLSSSPNEKYTELCKDYTSRMITIEEFMEEVEKYPTVFPYPKHLVDILDKIHDWTEDFGYEDDSCHRRLDMHSGNFLYRDGAIVVTDPWCESDMSDINDVNDWATRHNIG